MKKINVFKGLNLYYIMNNAIIGALIWGAATIVGTVATNIIYRDEEKSEDITEKEA